jgi:hypothetical protein
MNPLAGMPPPPPDPSAAGKGTAILGGCGVAGCLGAIVAVVLLAGVVIVTVASLASSPSAGPTAGPSDTSGPVVAANLPNHGPLRTLIRTQVGAYSLVTTAAVTKYPELLLDGMVDSLGAVYLTPGGQQLNEMILAYTSAEVARRHMDTVLAAFQATYGPNAGIALEPVRNQNNVIIGARLLVNEPGGVQHVYWSNSNVLFIVTSYAPHAARFHEASPH